MGKNLGNLNTDYIIKKGIKCLKCGNIGGYSNTEDRDRYTVFHCLNCDNSGSIDTYTKGVVLGFAKISKDNILSEVEILKLTIKAFEYYYPRVPTKKIPCMDYAILSCGHRAPKKAPCCKKCADEWIFKYVTERKRNPCIVSDFVSKFLKVELYR